MEKRNRTFAKYFTFIRALPGMTFQVCFSSWTTEKGKARFQVQVIRTIGDRSIKQDFFASTARYGFHHNDMELAKRILKEEKHRAPETFATFIDSL